MPDLEIEVNDDYFKDWGKTGTTHTQTQAGFPYMFEQDIMAQEPPEYIIDAWLPEDALIVTYGQPKTYKSFAVLHMAMCITHGMPWYGHDVKQGAVVYIAAEGVGGFGKRVKAWKKHHAITKASPFVTITTSVNMAEADEAKKLALQIIGLEQDYNFKVALVVVDTVARCTPGSDENSNTAMGLVVTNLDSLRVAVKASVLCVHHEGKSKGHGMRGASSLHGALNTSIHVEREGDTVSVHLIDQKDDLSGLIHFLTTVEVELPPSQAGKPQGSIILTERQEHVITSKPYLDGLTIDPRHTDRVAIASQLPEHSRQSVTETTVTVFGNSRYKERVIEAVPPQWINVETPNGVRQLRRIKLAGQKGEIIECHHLTKPPGMAA